MSLRKLLLAAYHFPPFGGSGVQRAVKLAEYLPASGWQAHVLTAGHDYYPVSDAGLLQEVQGRAQVHRVLGWEPGALAKIVCRHGELRGCAPAWLRLLQDRLCWRLDRQVDRLRLPERELLWTPAAIRQARRIVQDLGVEAVVTTSPPLSAHWLGWRLKRRLGVAWIADLRDPVVDNFVVERHGSIAGLFRRWMERLVLAKADHCVTTCPELIERLRERYPAAGSERFSWIANGFDSTDGGQCERPSRRAQFVLAYVGAFYREQSIGPILEAVRRLLAARAELRRQFEFRVVGSLSATQRALVRAEDAAFVNIVGYLPHEKAVREMAMADALLLTTPANDGGRLCIPAKTFEYLAFGRHVLAFVHGDTILSRLLSQAGNTTVLHHPVSVEAMTEAIGACFDAWQAGRSQRPRDRRLLEPFRRDRLAERYARIVEAVVDGKPGLRLAQASGAAEAAA